ITSFCRRPWPRCAPTVVIAIGAVSPRVHNTRRCLFMPLAATLLGVVLYAPTVLEEAADPAHHRLHRDVAGAFVYAIAVPVIVSWRSAILAGRGVSPTHRLLAALGTALLCLATSPLYFLFVHCTSGDCL